MRPDATLALTLAVFAVSAAPASRTGSSVSNVLGLLAVGLSCSVPGEMGD